MKRRHLAFTALAVLLGAAVAAGDVRAGAMNRVA
jgi:hypothetical protein